MNVSFVVYPQVMVVRRDTGAKQPMAWGGLEAGIKKLMEDMQADLLKRATEERDSRIAKVTKWEDFIPALDNKMMVLAPWCDEMVSWGLRTASVDVQWECMWA